MPNWRMTSTRYRKSAGRQFNSLSAPGGGEGWGEVGDSRALAGAHLTLPSLRDGPLPLPPEGRRGAASRLSSIPGTGQRAQVRRGLGMALGLGLLLLGGCGWAPLYADRETGPADEEVRAIRVAPISERIGQKLALALRQSLNPTGEPASQRYLLRVTLQTARQDLGVQTQGFGTRGRLDAYANFFLSDSTSGTQLLSGTSHVADSFDILANEYSDVVAEDDARTRTVEEMRRDIVTRLTLFLQRRVAERAVKPATPCRRREAARRTGRGLSAPPRPRDPRRSAVWAGYRPGPRAGRHAGASDLPRFARPVSCRRSRRFRFGRRSGAARRRGGADRPDGWAARRAGARGRRCAGPAVCPVSRRDGGRCARHRRGWRPARPFRTAPRLRHRAARRCDRLLSRQRPRPRPGDPRCVCRTPHRGQSGRHGFSRPASRRGPDVDPGRTRKADALCRRWRTYRA